MRCKMDNPFTFYVKDTSMATKMCIRDSHSIMQIQPGDQLSLRFCDGEADCTVDQIGEEPSHADQKESEL